MRMADAIPLPAVLWRRLGALGIDPSEMLRRAGLPDNLQFEAKPKVSTKDFFGLWRALEAITLDPLLGVRIATGASPDQLDIASVAAMHAATLGDAITTFGRYKRLVCPEDVVVSRQPDGARVSFHWLRSDDAPPALLIDACMATVLVLAEYGAETDLKPIRLELSRPEQHRDALEHHFQCPIIFDSWSDALILPNEALDLRFQTANRDLLDMLIPGLETELALRTGSTQQEELPNRVKKTLRTQMQGQRPTVDSVARALAMSSRTLQRRLAESGTTYQSLLDDVRRAAAVDLLARTDLESGEIAFLLGFEEVNSFIRAFSAWESVSPAQWRQTRRPQHLDGSR